MEEKSYRIEKRLDSLENSVSNMRWWILGTCLTTILSVVSIIIAFMQYQSSWLQLVVNRNWEIAQKSLEKIEATQMRLERIDALREVGLLQFQREEQSNDKK